MTSTKIQPPRVPPRSFRMRAPAPVRPARFKRPAIAVPPVSPVVAPSPGTAQEFGLSFTVFCAFTFVLVARPQDYFPVLEPLRPALSFMIVSLLLTIVTSLDTAAASLRSRATGLYLFFFATMIATAPFSIHRRLSLDFVLQGYIVNVVYFLLLLINVNTLAKFERLILVIALSGLAFTGLALQYGTFSGGRYFAKMQLSRRGRMIGVGFDPNDIAFVVVSLLSFALCVLLGRFRRLAKAAALAAVVLGILLALYTGSRGGLLGLTTFLVLFLLIRVPGVPKKGKFWTIALLSVFVYFNSDKINVDRYLTLSDVSSDYNASDEFGRVAIWTRGLQIFSERPLTGVGAGRFGQAIGTDRKEEGILPEWQAPHNSYIQVLVELGIFGGLSFCLLLAGGVKTLNRLRRESFGGTGVVRGYAALLLVGFIAQLVSAFFLSQAYSVFLTLSAAVITALSSIASAERSKLSDAPRPA